MNLDQSRAIWEFYDLETDDDGRFLESTMENFIKVVLLYQKILWCSMNYLWSKLFNW